MQSTIIPTRTTDAIDDGDEIRFYERYLGRTLTVATDADEDPLAARTSWARDGMALRAHLVLGGAARAARHQPEPRPARGAFLMLIAHCADDLNHAYDVLADGGTVVLPLRATTFARRVAILRDRFGTSWLLLCQREDTRH